MTPVAEPYTGAEERYNSAHAKTRCIVERSLTILKARFRCLLNKERSLLFSPERCVTIIIVCSVLHNLAKRYFLQDPEIEEDFYNNEAEEEAQQLYIQPDKNGRVARTELINDRYAIHLFEMN